MIDIQNNLSKEIETVQQIPIVPMMLETICQITGMRFAAIARVTNNKWVACSVRDEVQFGLQAGGELKIETTLCNEIRDHRQAVIIDDVEEDPQYYNHHTPKIYGLKSYISFPIILKDGSFFGTLCAIDSRPAQVNNPKVIGIFTMLAELLSFHLQSLDLLERSYQSNIDLHKMNNSLTKVNQELDNFVYTASHDLKSPISNIEGLLEVLTEELTAENFNREQINKIVYLMKSSVNSFNLTLQDLTAVVETATITSIDEKSEEINIFEIVKSVEQDLIRLIEASQAKVEVFSKDNHVLYSSKKNMKSILYNLISNAIKYRSPARTPQVLVKLEEINGKSHLSVTDNGLGIPLDMQDQVFIMFKRFHSHVEGSGLGLYIVKRMVDNMNGQIQVTSTLNKGTTFNLIFLPSDTLY